MNDPIEIRLKPETQQKAEEFAASRGEARATFLRKVIEKALILYGAEMLPLE